MSNEFTGQAKKIWDEIPIEFQGRLITNVWRSSGRRVTTITNFKERVKQVTFS